MPLSWATRKGHGAVVEVLLEIVAATASGIYETLFLAAAQGQDSAVKMLTSSGDIDLAAQDEHAVTVLQLAVSVATRRREAISDRRWDSGTGLLRLTIPLPESHISHLNMLL
ncbi:hypothetical protein Micbo1qcDRAFT_169588, partial [Microdochium bolleyi]